MESAAYLVAFNTPSAPALPPADVWDAHVVSYFRSKASAGTRELLSPATFMVCVVFLLCSLPAVVT